VICRLIINAQEKLSNYTTLYDILIGQEN